MKKYLPLLWFGDEKTYCPNESNANLIFVNPYSGFSFEQL
jgi:hypothetical protein